MRSEIIGYGREILYPRVQEVIISKVSRGEGKPEDPAREVTQFHALNGEFIGEWDEYMGLKLRDKE